MRVVYTYDDETTALMKKWGLFRDEYREAFYSEYKGRELDRQRDLFKDQRFNKIVGILSKIEDRAIPINMEIVK